MKNIDKEIEDFVKSIRHLWKDEPLTGDETKAIADKVLAELDFVNGNV